MWDQVKAENPEKKMWEIGSIIGQLWRELSEDVKNEYCEEYEVDKVTFNSSYCIICFFFFLLIVIFRLNS